VYWIHLSQNKVQCFDSINMAMKLRVS